MVNHAVADEAPWSDGVSEYDQCHYEHYFELLRAEERGCGIEQMAETLGIDPAHDPARTEAIVRSYLRRAHWIQSIIHPPLTEERRRSVCHHEAGHAVMYALGGAFVYRVAVAPEGCVEWQIESRKEVPMTDLWGMCSASDLFIHPDYLAWDADDWVYRADRKGFESLLRTSCGNVSPRARRGHVDQWRRQIRAHVCACLAGPIATQIYLGEDVWVDEGNCDFGQRDDLTRASGLAQLLPWRNEFDHLAAVTERVLRQTTIWSRVCALAEALERHGDIEDLCEFLPAPLSGWPPSPRAKSSAPFDRIDGGSA